MRMQCNGNDVETGQHCDPTLTNPPCDGPQALSLQVKLAPRVGAKVVSPNVRQHISSAAKYGRVPVTCEGATGLRTKIEDMPVENKKGAQSPQPKVDFWPRAVMGRWL